MTYKTLDFTKGSPTKNLLIFTVPTLLGGLIQQVYSLADAIIIGQFVSATALGSIGMTGSITFFFYALCSGIAVAITTIIGQYVGAGDKAKIKETIFNSAAVMIAVSVAMSVICYFISPFMVSIMQTPPEIYGGAIEYLSICSFGIIAIAVYDGVAGILRALGDSKSPIYFLSGACIINIILDFVAVVILKMGISGAAIATVISEYCCAVGCTVYAFAKNPYFRLKKENLKIEKEILRNIVKIGLPASFQSFMIEISCLILQRYINAYGAVMVSACTVISKVEQIVQQGNMALETSVAAYTAQNMGAGFVGRVKKGYRSASVITVIFALTVSTLAFVFAPYIVRCFTSEAEVIETGTIGLRCVCYFYLPLGFIYSTRGVLNGCGDSFYQFFNGFFEVGGRIIFPLILCAIPFIGQWGVVVTGGCTWVVVAIVSVLRYKQGKWQSMTLVRPKNKPEAKEKV